MTLYFPPYVLSEVSDLIWFVGDEIASIRYSRFPAGGEKLRI